MNFIGSKEFKDFIETQGEFRRKLAYLVLSGKETDEVVKELKQKIKRYEFLKDRVVFDFDKIDSSANELAKKISASAVGSTYDSVYQKITGGARRGYKLENIPADLVELICDHEGCEPSDFIVPYTESEKSL